MLGGIEVGAPVLGQARADDFERSGAYIGVGGVSFSAGITYRF
ncbi:MAG: hypothetical protein OSB70_07840 [Myxococcota bacterium]|nr:hypothetical protein [Myxococcota bacterium]